ncbi:MAG: transglutaminase domain-containing protein [Planctomycetota bacterium]
MTRRIRLIVVVVVAVAASPSYADVWDEFIESAAAEHGDVGRRAAVFLAEHRPQRDSAIELALLEQNLRLALQARREFPWAAALSEAQFFNDVLPYASLDETRESWRQDLYERGRGIVADCASATEAAQALNRKLFNDIEVHYNTGRKLPNQSPAESIAQGRATCTGLSILLVDACRAVGVPARIAGVANWHDKRGNHTWVEIWDGDWHFTGADEYNAQGLNRAWFAGDARKAQPGSVEHAVWATSWAATGAHFPMVWNPDDTGVPAVDVTRRYVGDTVAGTPAATGAAAAGARVLHVRLWTTTGGERISARVEALDADGNVIDQGTTRDGSADLNDMPALTVSGDDALRLRISNAESVRTVDVAPNANGPTTLDLAWDALALSRDEAEQLVRARWDARCEAIRRERAAELEAATLQVDEHALRIKERTFGAAPADGRSLWISMHGGGGAPKRVNDGQWANQIKLYEPAEGIYIAPRAPADTWDLWHRPQVDVLFDRLIETYVAARGVNPDRVYLLGYSAGGDGVFQLAPRMADRFAAASMMAGHPNETKPLGLRNLPFAIFMGGEDGAYDRNGVAAEWEKKLASLQADDPDGYPHKVTIYDGLGHWMNGRDAEALPWMAAFERNPWPTAIVWHQDDVTHTRFYWLSIAEGTARPRTTIRASVDGQTVTIQVEKITGITLRLRDELIDLDQPITVLVNGQTVHDGLVPRTLAAVDASLRERADHRSAATALLSLQWESRPGE